MEKLIIDDVTLRLIHGVLNTMQALVLALQAPSGFSEEIFAEILERRIDSTPEAGFESFPLAAMLKSLRPDDPPHPILELIQGGKK